MKSVKEKPETIMKLAGSLLSEKWTQAFLVMLAAYIVSNLLNIILIFQPELTSLQSRTGIYTTLVSGPVKYFVCLYIKLIVRKRDVTKDALIRDYKYSTFINTVILYILTDGVIIWVISALSAYMNMIALSVFYIAISICYSVAFFYIADNPGKGPLVSIMYIWELMRKNFVQYMLFNFRYFPFALLAYLPGFFVNIMLNPGIIEEYGVQRLMLLYVLGKLQLHPAAFILSLLVCGLRVYLYTGRYVYYELAMEKLMYSSGTEVKELEENTNV